MITDNEGNWHYLTITSISRLFRGVASNNNGDFCCLNCLHSYRTENALKNHERLWNNYDYCKTLMPTKGKNIVKHNSGEKTLKVANAIYFDLETLQIKQQSAQNNPIQSYTEIKTINEVCGYSLALERTYDKSTHKYYRAKDCMEQFCNDLQTLAIKIINTEKIEIIPLTNKQKEHYESRKCCHICRKKFCIDENNKKYLEHGKVRGHDHYTGKFRGTAHSICNLRYSATREISLISHNGTNYDYHFTIKELAKKFNTQDFNCSDQNMEKYITFKVPIKK